MFPPFRVAQEGGAGERRDVRHAGVGRDGERGARRRGADRADEREDLVLGDQAAGVGDSDLGLVGVVQRQELQPAPVNAAHEVRFAEGGDDAGAHLVAEVPGGTAESGRLAEQHEVVGNARAVGVGRLLFGLRRLRLLGARGDGDTERAEGGEREGAARAARRPDHPLLRLTSVSRLRPSSRR